MKCLICKNTLRVPGYAFANAEEYQQSAVVVTECCQSAIVIQPRITFNIREYVGNRRFDDWGEPIKNQKENEN